MSKNRIPESKLSEIDKLASQQHSGIIQVGKSGQNSEEQLKNLEAIATLKNQVLKFIACYLIPMYKRERTSVYHKILKDYINKELTSAKNTNVFWKTMY